MNRVYTRLDHETKKVYWRLDDYSKETTDLSELVPHSADFSKSKVVILFRKKGSNIACAGFRYDVDIDVVQQTITFKGLFNMHGPYYETLSAIGYSYVELAENYGCVAGFRKDYMYQ